MYSFLLAIVLLCVHHAHTSEHGNLKNVAYMKKVTLSSYQDERRYPGSNAVNGKFNDLTASDWEVSPWLRIDLGQSFEIHEIEVFARTDCCEGLLHDFEFKVGSSPDHMRSCGRYTGSTKNGQRIAVFCPAKTVGQFVQLQIVEGEKKRNEPCRGPGLV